MRRFWGAGGLGFAVAFGVLFALDCQTPAILTVDKGAPGCTRAETTCVGADLKPTGFCCPESHACGGAFPNVGCPAGFCCFVGFSSRADGGLEGGLERGVPMRAQRAW